MWGQGEAGKNVGGGKVGHSLKLCRGGLASYQFLTILGVFARRGREREEHSRQRKPHEQRPTTLHGMLGETVNLCYV